MLIRHFTLVLLFAACGGKTTDDGDGGSDASFVDVPVMDANPLSDASGECNTIDPGTKTISIEEVPQDPPPLAGSSAVIQPGLYQLDSFTLYTGPNGPSGNSSSIAGEVRVDVANSAEYIFQAAIAQNNQITRSNSQANNAGPTTLTIAPTCPQPADTVQVQYAADASSFTIRVTMGNQSTNETFVLIGP